MVITAHPARTLISTATDAPTGIITEPGGTVVLYLIAQPFSEVECLLGHYFARGSRNQAISIIVPGYAQVQGRRLHITRHPFDPGLSDYWTSFLASMHHAASQALK